jgi:hypothetical protein
VVGLQIPLRRQERGRGKPHLRRGCLIFMLPFNPHSSRRQIAI